MTTAFSRLSTITDRERLVEVLPALIGLVSQAEETLAKLDELERACRALGIWSPDSPEVRLAFHIRARLQPALLALETELSKP
jgi:hypothetical protein